MTGAMTRKEQLEDGRSRRNRVSRASHGDWQPAKDRPDPVALLMADNEGRVEDLVPIRFGRMAANPFAFLRGSAGVMAADLAAMPHTGLDAQLCGDCHLMNFGLFATPERNVVFGLNDFDETVQGPWEWDLKRLAASFVVASQDVRLPDKKAVEIAIAAVRSYRTRIQKLATMSPLEVWYDRIDLARAIEDSTDSAMKKRRQQIDRQARRRVAENLYPKLITNDGGTRRIADQPPLIYHPEGVSTETVVDFLATYRSSLPKDRRVLFDRYTIEDAAIKVVGVGSVGTLCFIALFSDDDGHPLLLQVKEANKSALAPYVAKRKGKTHNGERVVVGQHLMQPASDIFLGWGTGKNGREFYVRQLRDMKLSVTLSGDVLELTRYAEFCGIALARAHANTGSAAAISAYLGTSDKFDEALGQFGLAYARQTVRDHAALVDAIESGRVPAIFETL